MKVKLYKKIVSLVSAFSLAVTGLTGLSLSASAGYTSADTAFDPKASNFINSGGDGASNEDVKEITKTVGSDDEISIKVASNGSKIYVDDDAVSLLIDNDFDDDTDVKLDMSDQSNYMWVLETTTPGAGSNAVGFKNKTVTKGNKYNITKKLTYKDTQGSKAKVSSLLPTSNGVLSLGNFKANGLFNNTVVVKLVSADYKVQYTLSNPDDPTSPKAYMRTQGYEYAAFRIFVTPAKVNSIGCTTANKTNKAGIKFNPPTINPTTGAESTKGSLELEEGKSFKLPYNVTKGLAADTSLIWSIDNSNVATVVNGTVKAISAGTAVVTVKSATDPDSIKKSIDVTVTPGAVKALRANTTSIDLITRTKGDSDSQTITISPKTPVKNNAKFTYNVKFEKKPANFKIGTANANANGNIITSNDNGVISFSVSAKSGVTSLEKGEKLTVTLTQIGNDKITNVKPITIGLKMTTYPEYAKGFKETVKLNKASGYRELNLIKGTCYNLGVSVNPVTANTDFSFKAYEMVNGSITTDVTGSKVKFIGDVVFAVDNGTYELVATGARNSEGNLITTDTYLLNVYEPSSKTFELKDGKNHSGDYNKNKMTIKGGYLMEENIANTFCDKEIDGGMKYSFTAPNCGGSNEPVNWKVNKPGLVNLELTNGGGIMSITVLAEGTYTVTGVSAYTNQKCSFKVAAKASENSSNISAIDSNANADLNLTTKKTYQIVYPNTGYCGKKITFAVDAENSTNPKAVSVNGNGLITAKKDGEAFVLMNIYSSTKVSTENLVDTYTINVNVDATTTTIGSVNVTPAYVNGNADSAVSFKADNSKGYKWYAYCASFPTFEVVQPANEGNPINISVTAETDKYVEITKTKKLPKYFTITNKDALEVFDNETGGVNASGIYNELEWKIFPWNDSGAPTGDDIDDTDKVDPANIKTVTALRYFMTKNPKIVDPSEIGGPSIKTIGKDNTVDKKTNKITAYNGVHTIVTTNLDNINKFKLPIALDPKNPDAALLSGETDQIVWTISNKNLITSVIEVPLVHMSGYDSSTGETTYFREYEFAVNAEGYTGKVTLTGVTRNGNKTIKQVVWITRPERV